MAVKCGVDAFLLGAVAAAGFLLAALVIYLLATWGMGGGRRN